MKKFLISLFCISLIIFAVTIVPSISSVSAYSDKDAYVVYNSIDKEIVIASDKVATITETIEVEYLESGINVGISRNLSRKNNVTRIVDGKKYSVLTLSKFELISLSMNGADEYHFVETDDEYYYINTGADGDFKSAGVYTYKIVYKYDMGEDFIKEFDDFTFDILDYGFASPVENFSASITLPKSFDANKLSFRTNNMTNIDGQSVGLVVADNTISVNMSNLNSQEGLTMQLILPSGYFNTHFVPDWFYILSFVIAMMAIVGIIALIIVKKNRYNVIITPEFYPPEGFSPIDVARVYRGKIKSKDLSSLIIYWASKGLIEMTTNSNGSVTLKKLKDYNLDQDVENNLKISKSNEKKYFESLFEKRENVTIDDSYVGSSALKKAVGNLYIIPGSTSKEEKIFKLLSVLFSVLPFLLYIIWYAVTFNDYFVFFLAVFLIISTLIFINVSTSWFFKIVWCLIFGGAPLVILGLSRMPQDLFGLFFISTLILVFGAIVQKFILKFYTKKEIRDRGKVLGFKKFLLLAERDKLEALIEDNPTYYYDILPFCYVFGITKKMEEKFASLKMTPPANMENVDISVAGSVMIMHSLSHISIRPAKSLHIGSIGSSGGFGGGSIGSSGGGGGGGGSRGR